MLELIIERGMQILQTSEGEKLPRVIETLVRQLAAEPGQCQFTMYVDGPGLCKYDDQKKRITTPGGLALRGVEVLKYKPAESELKPAMVLCKCLVGFHYPTTHLVLCKCLVGFHYPTTHKAHFSKVVEN